MNVTNVSAVGIIRYGIICDRWFSSSTNNCRSCVYDYVGLLNGDCDVWTCVTIVVVGGVLFEWDCLMVLNVVSRCLLGALLAKWLTALLRRLATRTYCLPLLVLPQWLSRVCSRWCVCETWDPIAFLGMLDKLVTRWHDRLRSYVNAVALISLMGSWCNNVTRLLMFVLDSMVALGSGLLLCGLGVLLNVAIPGCMCCMCTQTRCPVTFSS